ncbi:uncharacterized protein LOC112555584 [Pomacea canaliculata]|uniref:uncharacterized protein LOC112555584 n=1 Tax=Pomacea canaliculata TaxID=400727 RepID=UPI000D735FCC|nr:uncharacterized protein LOC112555584 [Pomacea canaliculata]
MQSGESLEKLQTFLQNTATGHHKYMTLVDTGCSFRFCGYCGASCALRRCGACFQVYYCSKTCQRAHWRHHKALCRQQLMTPRGPTFASGQSFPEKGTGDATFNSDNVAHASDFTPAKGDGDAKSKHVSFGVSGRVHCAPCLEKRDEMRGVCPQACHEASRPLKSCGRCGAVIYCSKACQREDWPSHKVSCKKTERSTDDCKVFDDFARHLGTELPDYHTQPGSWDSNKSILTWPQALKEAETRYPNKLLLTRIRDVTYEYDLSVGGMASSVLVLRLSRPHLDVFRHGWYLQDTKGQEIPVFFYLDHDLSEPYFTWRQLSVGNFFCLEHAYIHVFLDGQVGIRVDDANEVSIITG